MNPHEEFPGPITKLQTGNYTGPGLWQIAVAARIMFDGYRDQQQVNWPDLSESQRNGWNGLAAYLANHAPTFTP